MKLYPNEIYSAIENIDIEKLKEKGIKGIILDVDNTLIDSSKVLNQKVIDWVKGAKNLGMKICILSNTNKRKKVEKVANDLDLPYFMFAIKPMKRGFKKCIKLLELEPKNICAIGDQIFTDVLGGNRMGMYTIYTKPINEKDCSITTTIKRPIEKIILKKYEDKKGMN